MLTFLMCYYFFCTGFGAMGRMRAESENNRVVTAGDCGERRWVVMDGGNDAVFSLLVAAKARRAS